MTTEDQATAASTPDTTILATKADLAALKADILYWIVGGFMVQTAVLLSVLAIAT